MQIRLLGTWQQTYSKRRNGRILHLLAEGPLVVSCEIDYGGRRYLALTWSEVPSALHQPLTEGKPVELSIDRARLTVCVTYPGHGQ